MVVVAVKTQTPLLGPPGEVEPIVDEIGQRLVPRARGRMTREVGIVTRLELLRVGYDALVIQDVDGEGTDFVVALLPQNVKVAR
jgi:D-aminopeptidase